MRTWGAHVFRFATHDRCALEYGNEVIHALCPVASIGLNKKRQVWPDTQRVPRGSFSRTDKSQIQAT